nr:hypothetical protein [Mucilaginibacter humi]
MKTLSAFIIMLCCLLLGACSHAPEPIRYGKDACAHCKMTIMDKRFSSELVTAKGKVFKFDAAECMTAYLKENPAQASDPKSNFWSVISISPASSSMREKPGFYAIAPSPRLWAEIWRPLVCGKQHSARSMTPQQRSLTGHRF